MKHNQTWVKPSRLLWWWFCVVDRWRPCLMKAITCVCVVVTSLDALTHRPFFSNSIQVTQILFLLRSDTKSHIEVKVEPIFFFFFADDDHGRCKKIRHLRESGGCTSRFWGNGLITKWRPLRDKDVNAITDWGRFVDLKKNKFHRNSPTSFSNKKKNSWKKTGK